MKIEQNFITVDGSYRITIESTTLVTHSNMQALTPADKEKVQSGLLNSLVHFHLLVQSKNP